MTKPHASRAQLFLFGLLLSFALLVQAQPSKGFLWEVQSGSTRVFLMGSIHFANAEFYPLSNAIEQAFASSDRLAVEVDLGAIDPLTLQAQMLLQGSYPEKETLRDHLDNKTLKALEEYLVSNGLPLELFIAFRPGVLVMTLTAMELAKYGMLPSQGIDLYFLKRARGQKDILALETLEEQFSLLIDAGADGRMLQQTLAEFKHFPKMIEALTQSWQTGDEQSLKRWMIDEPLKNYPEYRKIHKAIFTDRNLRMTEKIEGFLATQQTHFVVVGAGHLIGKGGIIDLLGNKGYQVVRR